MARTIINNYSENRLVKEKLLGFIPIARKYIDWYLSVNRPSQTEERIYLGTQKVYYSAKTKEYYAVLINVTEDVYNRGRMLKIQELINNLEKEGFHVKTDQLALFINYKIENLILDKK